MDQLLALDEPARLEIAHTLMESVEASEDDMSDDERERLYAALNRSFEQVAAGQTVPYEEVMAELRAKRTTRAQ
jgi:predicted transcriptional regulator